ncbi:MAG: hypothetical protein HYX68_08455 [Planctomycetes bacterium]|nr:hypothetical protein [Planctomycetota bacterium]
MLRTLSFLAAALCCFALTALAQGPAQPDKKAKAGKGEPGKSNNKASDKNGKDAPRIRIPLDKMNLPPDAIIVVVEDLLKARELLPSSALVDLQVWLAQQERIKALDKKVERKIPGLCRLAGRLDGDFLVFTADFDFFTEEPNTAIYLGLKGCYLTDEGKLDGETPIFDLREKEGLFVRVEKPGLQHHLTLKFRVPALVRKTSSGAYERVARLDLPGSETPMTLDLPGNVKELIWNDTLEKSRTPGRWKLGLGQAKTVTLLWSEPVSFSGNTPLPKAESKIRADVYDTHVGISGEIILEDVRGQTTEWRLALPAQTKIEKVTAPGGLTVALTPPEKGKPYFSLNAPATTKRLQVSFSLQVPRANLSAKVPVGPFHVLGAFQHRGSFAVNTRFGQRPVITRFGEVYQETNTESAATFTFVAPPVTEKNLKTPQVAKAPLELEWRPEKNQLETKVSHALRLQAGSHGWDIEATSKIQVKTLFTGIQFIDLQMPTPRLRGVSLIGSIASGLEFPGTLPWSSVWATYGMPWTHASPDEFVFLEEQGTPLKVGNPDAKGKTRIFLNRDQSSPIKQMTLILKTTYRVPPYNQRVRLELPRPLNTLDRGARAAVHTGKQIELMQGPFGMEEPTPDPHVFDFAWEQTPAALDLAWRPYRQRVISDGTVDILLHKHTAEVRQLVRLAREAVGDKGEAGVPDLLLNLPAGLANIEVVSGGTKIKHDPVANRLWVRPEIDGKFIELRLRFDLAIVQNRLHLVPVAPATASRLDVKVRLWSAPGVTVSLDDGLVKQGEWKERSIEKIPGKEQFPTLVLQGFGAVLSLSVKLTETTIAPPAVFIADRALIQARMLENQSQQCRAFYLLSKIHASHVDIELPVPAPLLRDGPTFWLGKQCLDPFEKIDAAGKVVRVRLHPELIKLPAVLEIRYTIPAENMETNRFWRTTMHAPTFRSKVEILEMRWHWTAPDVMLAAVFGRPARLNPQWNWQNGLLTPETHLASGELEAWVGAVEPWPTAPGTGFAFSEISLRPETIYHLPREGWLLVCSGLFLVFSLGAYYSPLPRVAFWLLVLTFALSVLTLGVLLPTIMPPVLYGLQPGVLLFALFAVGHWLLEERERRQMVFHSGFSRGKPGSTMMRTKSAKRPREASTVDEPDQSASAMSEKASESPAGG